MRHQQRRALMEQGFVIAVDVAESRQPYSSSRSRFRSNDSGPSTPRRRARDTRRRVRRRAASERHDARAGVVVGRRTTDGGERPLDAGHTAPRPRGSGRARWRHRHEQRWVFCSPGCNRARPMSVAETGGAASESEVTSIALGKLCEKSAIAAEISPACVCTVTKRRRAQACFRRARAALPRVTR